MNSVDICIIGGGPAGMAAASMAAEEGLRVALIDERPSAGGQTYRGLEDGPFREESNLGSDYSDGSVIIERFRAANIEALFGASLWRVDMTENGGFASYSRNGIAHRLAFRKLILATGAVERAVAFEGWMLPGVMSVGAAQLLLKSSAAVPSGKIVLAGNGPLLLLFATQLLSLGIEISAILDTAPKVSKIAVALKNLGGFISNRDKVKKGLRMQRDIRAAKIPIHRNVSQLRATGGNRVAAIMYEANGKQNVIDADTLLYHEGVLPNTQLSLAVGCKQIWDESQKCHKPETDQFGESSVAGVFIVGDGATINGAIAAPPSGEIAVGRILEQINRATDRSRGIVSRSNKTIRIEKAFRPFLDQLYPPRIAVAPVSDATIVCRCEEVSAGKLRAAIKDGAIGPSQAKVYTRCGMGPCQGRMCGLLVSQLIAHETGQSIAEIGSYNVRYPLKPVTLLEMAQCGEAEDYIENQHAS